MLYNKGQKCREKIILHKLTKKNVKMSKKLSLIGLQCSKDFFQVELQLCDTNLVLSQKFPI